MGASMASSRNPLAGLLLLLGSGLTLGGAAWGDAHNLIRYPVTVMSAAAAVLIIAAVAALVARAVAADAIAVVLGLLLAGYVANTVILSLYFVRSLNNGLGLLLAGGLVLIAGAVAGIVGLVRVQTPRAQVQAATTGVAPAGWYPDPSGGVGQRYWDGIAWGQSHP